MRGGFIGSPLPSISLNIEAGYFIVINLLVKRGFHVRYGPRKESLQLGFTKPYGHIIVDKRIMAAATATVQLVK